MSAERWGAQRWTGTRRNSGPAPGAHRWTGTRHNASCSSPHPPMHHHAPQESAISLPSRVSSPGIFPIPLKDMAEWIAVLLAGAQNCRVGEAERTCGTGQRPRQCDCRRAGEGTALVSAGPRRTTMRAARCELAGLQRAGEGLGEGPRKVGGTSWCQRAAFRGRPQGYLGTESCLCPGEPRTAFPALQVRPGPGTES